MIFVFLIGPRLNGILLSFFFSPHPRLFFFFSFLFFLLFFSTAKHDLMGEQHYWIFISPTVSLFVRVPVGAAENCVVRPKHCPLLIHWFYDGTRWVSLRHRWRMIIGITLPESTVWFPKQVAVTHARKSSIATTHPSPKTTGQTTKKK